MCRTYLAPRSLSLRSLIADVRHPLSRNFDPIAVAIGPFAIRWYALAYIVGLLIGWRYCLWRWRSSRPPSRRRAAIDDFLVWATLGVVLGGRLGYVLFYQAGFYFANPSEILALWHGGMSFHGGALGVLAALVLFCRQRSLSLLAFADIIACAVPIGLFFGRIANFINGELWGRPTDVPWAMVFPNAGVVPRHPSQLYEAGLEGIVLFVILFYLVRFSPRARAAGPRSPASSSSAMPAPASSANSSASPTPSSASSGSARPWGSSCRCRCCSLGLWLIVARIPKRVAPRRDG